KYGVELLPRLLTEHGVAWQHNPLLDIREYIDNMPVCLAAADLVICRAGAITLSELQAAGRASILIPSPNVAENHQYHNAMVLVNRDAAEILEEKELTGERLTQMVKRFREDPTLASRLGANAKAMAMTTANSQIAEEILALL
ncbi:MAG: glycosyltransferase, partial [Angelakisella sp.]